MPKTHEVSRILTQHLEGVREHVTLRDLTAFGLGGVTDFYLEVTSIQQLMKAVMVARDIEIPWFILGTGTQTLLSDFGYPGLVIHNRTNHIECIGDTGQILVESGAIWPTVVIRAANHGLGGIEPFLTFPGSVGGALWQHRVDFSINPRSLIRSITVLDEQGRIVQMSAKMFFDSVHATLAILVVTLQLTHTRRDETVRKITRFEKQRRQFETSLFFGPIFWSDFATLDPDYLSSLFERAHVLGMKIGGAVFSEKRRNFIEVRGRVVAHDIRELIFTVAARLTEHAKSPPSIQVQFFGGWEQES